MSKAITHAIILSFTIAFAFLFSHSDLSQYELQIVAALFIILFIGKRVVLPTSPRSKLLESVIFTFVTVSLVNSTGGTASAFFFLIYFLLFSLSLLLEPVISVTSTLTLIIFYILSLPNIPDMKPLITIISLAFLTPFAMIIGQEYMEVQSEKFKVQNLQTTLTKSKENTFLFLSLVLKNHIKRIISLAENIMGDHEIHQIKRQAERMRKLIDQYEERNS